MYHVSKENNLKILARHLDCDFICYEDTFLGEFPVLNVKMRLLAYCIILLLFIVLYYCREFDYNIFIFFLV